MSHFCKIVDQPIDLAQVLSHLEDPRHGAQNIFVGNVRNHNMGKQVVSVSYDAFTELAENILSEICSEASKKWGEALKFVVFHRTGSLKIGESSIVIAVGSPHRDESYQASRYVIEQIKVRAPIWKKEFYTDGETEWVKGHTLCCHAHHEHHADEGAFARL
jgi:molybdopterin synthase catalytic subunit